MDIKNYVKRNVLNFKSQVLDEAYATKDDLANIGSGKSAYEGAVEAGYEGTEAEFNEALASVADAGSGTVENIEFGSEVVIDAD